MGILRINEAPSRTSTLKIGAGAVGLAPKIAKKRPNKLAQIVDEIATSKVRHNWNKIGPKYEIDWLVGMKFLNNQIKPAGTWMRDVQVWKLTNAMDSQ